MPEVKCANYMYLEGMQQTVKEYEAMWGHPDEPPSEITLKHMMENCSMCDYGDVEFSALSQAILGPAGDLTVKVQQEVKRMTGEPLKRKCYKEPEK
ncbi:hypothetical protein LCGC14_0787740 [marine sediment metagenome]|uniref:Uncharacterized protein n=1 Tax=marine sediment metagenome TaxID=412755 RepID=A0A0F9PTP6_9ZZZZ